MSRWIKLCPPNNFAQLIIWSKASFLKPPRFLPYSWLKAFTWLFWKLKELLQNYKLSRVEAFMRILRGFAFLYKFHSALDNLQKCKLGKSFIFLSFAKKLLRFCPRTSFYCGNSIKRTPFKANTPLRRTVVLYMDGFTVKKSL